jgi:hypothetical protein
MENAGGNNDTKCLYFPFCLDQAPLTWLESLKKYSIDKWDQLKDQFTSNFAGEDHVWFEDRWMVAPLCDE